MFIIPLLLNHLSFPQQTKGYFLSSFFGRFFVFGCSDVSSPVSPADLLVPAQSSPPSCPCCFPLLILPKECARNEAFVFVQWAGAGSKLNWMFSPCFRSSYSPASPHTLCLVHYLQHPCHNPPYCAHQYEGCCFDSMQLFHVQKESLSLYALFGVRIEKCFFSGHYMMPMSI